MRLRLSTSIVALTAGILAFTSTAHATDILSQGNDYAQPYSGPAKDAFKGFGLGIQGGGQFTALDVYDAFDGISADGLIGGVHGEYLFAMGRLRVGPYVEGGFSNVNTAVVGGDLLQQDYYYGGGLKLGVVTGETLIYARGGYERAIWTSDAFDGDAIADSFVVGGGLETMASENISLGLGVDYLVPNNIEDPDGNDITDALEESESLRAMVRITYRQ